MDSDITTSTSALAATPPVLPRVTDLDPVTSTPVPIRFSFSYALPTPILPDPVKEVVVQDTSDSIPLTSDALVSCDNQLLLPSPEKIEEIEKPQESEVVGAELVETDVDINDIGEFRGASVSAILPAISEEVEAGKEIIATELPTISEAFPVQSESILVTAAQDLAGVKVIEETEIKEPVGETVKSNPKPPAAPDVLESGVTPIRTSRLPPPRPPRVSVMTSLESSKTSLAPESKTISTDIAAPKTRYMAPTSLPKSRLPPKTSSISLTLNNTLLYTPPALEVEASVEKFVKLPSPIYTPYHVLPTSNLSASSSISPTPPLPILKPWGRVGPAASKPRHASQEISIDVPLASFGSPHLSKKNHGSRNLPPVASTSAMTSEEVDRSNRPFAELLSEVFNYFPSTSGSTSMTSQEVDNSYQSFSQAFLDLGYIEYPKVGEVFPTRQALVTAASHASHRIGYRSTVTRSPNESGSFRLGCPRSIPPTPMKKRCRVVLEGYRIGKTMEWGVREITSTQHNHPSEKNLPPWKIRNLWLEKSALKRNKSSALQGKLESKVEREKFSGDESDSSVNSSSNSRSISGSGSESESNEDKKERPGGRKRLTGSTSTSVSVRRSSTSTPKQHQHLAATTATSNKRTRSISPVSLPASKRRQLSILPRPIPPSSSFKYPQLPRDFISTSYHPVTLQSLQHFFYCLNPDFSQYAKQLYDNGIRNTLALSELLVLDSPTLGKYLSEIGIPAFPRMLLVAKITEVRSGIEEK